MIETVENYLEQGQAIALDWITSPAAYAQFGLLVAAWLVAVVVAAWARPRLAKLLTPAEGQNNLIAKVRRFAFLFLPILLPVFAYAFTAAGEQVTRSLFGSGAVIALGKRVFVFIAVRKIVNEIISDPFLKLLGRYVAIPIAALYVLGLLDPIVATLEATRVSMGRINFSVLAIVRAIIAGSILFWLGRWSADTGTTYIRAQENIRVPTRELAAKAFELAIFAAVGLVLLNVMGLDLSALALLGGAIGVGLGFGLQKIASNFISGIILLLEGQATVGDFVELDGGESGRIIKMGARATILETFDGKWIVVPNEDFITSRIVNWSDAGSGNRYEVDFSVSYDTDINLIPDIIEKAVASHPGVLTEPEAPDCELRGFGDSGVDFGVEFWVEGIDDGKNKYTSEVRFLIWNALKEAGVEIPFPQREIRYRDGHKPN
ncbi:MAG: mechanosensitive ion channel [Boseongicola sp.]|nr:mechanosensitive ion channel [Boseongicola sp.]MDD9978797.1 mechanosensitive ion channel [Boseongicola sp.]